MTDHGQRLGYEARRPCTEIQLFPVFNVRLNSWKRHNYMEKNWPNRDKNSINESQQQKNELFKHESDIRKNRFKKTSQWQEIANNRFIHSSVESFNHRAKCFLKKNPRGTSFRGGHWAIWHFIVILSEEWEHKSSEWLPPYSFR